MHTRLVANQIGFLHRNSHSGCNRPTRCLNELELAAKVLCDLVCNRPLVFPGLQYCINSYRSRCAIYVEGVIYIFLYILRLKSENLVTARVP